jgi:hypothetical protein
VRLALPVAALIAAAALVAASCSSSNGPQPAPTTDSPATDSPTTQATTQHGGYAVCLAEHGVPTPPAGPGAPPGVDQQTWAKAQQACADKAPGPEG